MASSFVLAPLSAPHDIPNMMLLLVVNDELKTRIQVIRQTLVLHDVISAHPYTFLDSEKPVISLLADQDIRSNQSALLQ